MLKINFVNNTRLQLLLILLLTILAYSNIFQNDLVLDDQTFILNWDKIQSFNFIPEILRGALPEGHLHGYRPIRNLFYVVSYYIWKNNIVGYHLQSLLIHLTVTILVYFIVRALTKKWNVAFIGALLFGVHPVHTEAISWITASFDSISFIFFFSAFLLYIHYQTTRKKVSLFFSLLLSLLSAFIYEMTLSITLLVISYDIYFSRAPKTSLKKNWKIYLAYLSTGLSYFLIRGVVLNLPTQSFYLGNSFIISTLSMTKAIIEYLRLLVFPLNLNFLHTLSGNIVVLPIKEKLTIEKIYTPDITFNTAVIVFLIFLCIWSFKHYRLVSFSISWFFITLLPVANIIPNAIIMAERYLYVVSFSYLLLLGLAINWLYNFKKAFKYRFFVFSAVIVVLAAYILLTYRRNITWSNNLSLWNDVYKKSPQNLHVLNNLGLLYEKQGDLDKASAYYKEAIKVDPGEYSIVVRNNLASIYVDQGKWDLAVEELTKAVELHDDSNFRYNLGYIYEQENRKEDAIREYTAALKLDPKYEIAKIRILGLSKN